MSHMHKYCEITPKTKKNPKSGPGLSGVAPNCWDLRSPEISLISLARGLSQWVIMGK